MKKKYFLFLTAIVIFLNTYSVSSKEGNSDANRMGRYNVVWDTPSKDASGVMPFGNGDIAAGVYAIENGDLYLLLAKNDAFTYMGDIFKTGRVRVSLKPNPFKTGKGFRQILDLPSGSVSLEADGVKLRIWADANRPVYHIEINSPRTIIVNVKPEFWKRFDSCVFNNTDYYTKSVLQQPPAGPTQDVELESNGRLLWYFAVGDRSVYSDDLKFYNIERMTDKFPDPFRFNTFGNLLESPDMELKEGALTGTGRRFDIHIHALTMQTPKVEKWIEAIEKQAEKPVNTAEDWKKHLEWWREFWNRSWILTSDRTVPVVEQGKLNGEASESGTREEKDGASLTAQSYNVFRFLMACQSRGRVQSKFNGGLFTQQLRINSSDTSMRSGNLTQEDGYLLTHEDDRMWGRRFTYQNQRLLYWPLLASGDFDMMKPFFDYYTNLLPVRKEITSAWFGHEGAYYRENIEPTGGERDCGEDGRPPRRKPGEPATFYHDYYFTSGLETLTMMTDYVNFTGNVAYRDSVMVPFAREVLLFFDKHYSRDTNGMLCIDPGQVLETWWHAINSSPDVAGLRFCLDGLLKMRAGTPEDHVKWQKFRSEIPEVSLQTIEGKTAIAPAKKWETMSNSENGELYPVFPFRCFGLGLGTEAIVDWTMRNRSQKNAFDYACWTQDQIHWAFAGNASECAKGLVNRFRNASSMCRFPLYGKEGPDSCPDLDHFGAGSIALQCMLVQEADGKILLLPAWPSDWDVDFKLHLSDNAFITGTVKDGKLLQWNIIPESRKDDVIVCQPQSI